jgi:hypothetical protein
MTQAQISALVARAVAKALKPELKAAKAKAAHTPFDSQAAIDRACKKMGFKAPGVANVNVLTYGKVNEDGTKTGWLAKGRRVRKGEKALKVGTLRLFHEEQTDAISE